LGIDVGLHGAIAAYDFVTKQLIGVKPMPLRSKSADGKPWIDTHALGFYCDFYSAQTLFAVVEQPNAMPNQGVTSMFRFGHACGIVEGVLGALQMSTMLVKPAVWKSSMGLGRVKKDSIIRAQKLFPFHADLFKGKHGDGAAEAVLLATYGEAFAGIVNNVGND
jgi:crossover junction endodeoxyribonuclease RuvC